MLRKVELESLAVLTVWAAIGVVWHRVGLVVFLLAEEFANCPLLKLAVHHLAEGCRDDDELLDNSQIFFVVQPTFAIKVYAGISSPKFSRPQVPSPEDPSSDTINQANEACMGRLHKLLKRVTPVYIRRFYFYVCLALVECWDWRHGRMRRTRAHIIRQYNGRTRKTDLSEPLWGIFPDGRLQPLTLGELRAQNWRLIAEGLAELGVTRGTVLEIGAGDGTNLYGLRKHMDKVFWFGCDLVPRDQEILPCDACYLPFASKSVDAIVTYHALEQMPAGTAKQVLREIARVSRAGLVCVEPDYQRGAWTQRLYMIRRDYIRDTIGPATDAGLKLLRHQWAYGGNPLNRPSLFVFGTLDGAS